MLQGQSSKEDVASRGQNRGKRELQIRFWEDILGAGEGSRLVLSGSLKVIKVIFKLLNQLRLG